MMGVFIPFPNMGVFIQIPNDFTSRWREFIFKTWVKPSRS